MQQPLAQASVRITRCKDAVLLFEEFLMSDAQGETQAIPLYTEQRAPVLYQLEIRKKGFYPIRIEDISLLPSQQLQLSIQLPKKAGQKQKEEKRKNSLLLPFYRGHILRKEAYQKQLRELQQALNLLSRYYPAIPPVTENAVYDEETETSLSCFQRMLALPCTGITEQKTWELLMEMQAELLALPKKE